MRMYRDSESIRRVSTEEPDNQLRGLIARRILDLADYSDYELENLLNIITIQPSDAIADLQRRWLWLGGLRPSRSPIHRNPTPSKLSNLAYLY